MYIYAADTGDVMLCYVPMLCYVMLCYAILFCQAVLSAAASEISNRAAEYQPVCSCVGFDDSSNSVVFGSQ